MDKYLIGFYDLGMFGEMVVEATDEECAKDVFRETYPPKKSRTSPYIARCELLSEAEERIRRGDHSLPANDNDWAYADFGNAYFESLNH